MRLLVISSLLISSWLPASGATLIVPDDYPTIQDAYEAAGPFGGDTILIGPGTYPGGLSINKPITIVGNAPANLVRIEGGAFTVGIDDNHPNHGVHVQFQHVTLVESEISLYYGGQYGTLVGANISECVFEGSEIHLSLDCSLYLTNSLFVAGTEKTAISIHFFMGGYGNPSAHILQNTVVGYAKFIDVIFSGAYTFQMENNIIVNCETALRANQPPLPVWSFLKCNDVFSCSTTYDGMADPVGVDGNIAVNPEFCNKGDYHLQRSSPCLPGNHPGGNACGLIGYSQEVCEQPVPTKATTWGSLKSRYR